MLKSAQITASNPRKVTQAFLGAAVATFLAGSGLIYCMSVKIKAQQIKTTNLEAQVGSSEQITKRLQATQAIYTQTCAQIDFLDKSVSQKAYVPTLLQQLQKLAETTDLTVTSVQPSPIAPPPATTTTSGKKVPPPPYDTMGLNLNVTGTYAATAKFIYGLTHFPKVLSVVSVQMSPGSSKSGLSLVTTSLHLTAYVFKDSKKAAVTSVTAHPLTLTSTVVPPTAAPTFSGAVGRATQGAVAATNAGNQRAVQADHTL